MDVTGAGIGTTGFEDDSAMGVRLSSPMDIGWALGTGGTFMPDCLNMVDVVAQSTRLVNGRRRGPIVIPLVHLPKRLAFLWLQLDLKHHNEYDLVSEFLIPSQNRQGSGRMMSE
jgi:hypothetical protein